MWPKMDGKKWDINTTEKNCNGTNINNNNKINNKDTYINNMVISIIITVISKYDNKNSLEMLE